jgi:hypothetical protein
MTCSAKDSLQELAYLELEHMDVEADPRRVSIIISPYPWVYQTPTVTK